MPHHIKDGAEVHIVPYDLYKALGFREVPLESHVYARGNIALELPLPPV
jgi:hypothetical protein